MTIKCHLLTSPHCYCSFSVFLVMQASYPTVTKWVVAAWAALPEDMIRRSFTAFGLVAMSNRETSIHSRLKELIFSDVPIILAGDSILMTVKF